ncbi:MAG TPA: YaeQ family protein [Polyangiales bacterium]|nr:YaeQ family protein [Polyangiales bacterium]
MALTATLHTLRVVLNDADRGVYETFELRIARHPSETLAYMLSRTLAYCIYWAPDIAFSKGLSTTDEPAVWIKSLDGRIELWIDVGQPSAERLHKASKAAQRVVVCNFQDPNALIRTHAGERIHRAHEIELLGLPKPLLEPLETLVERRMDWDVAISGGQLYVTTEGQTLAGELTRCTLGS